MNTIEGSPSGEGRRFGWWWRFNHFVTEPLLEGAVAGLKEHGVRDEDLTVVRVPGTFELPPVALRMALGRFDAIIAIGAVIRETPHFDYVAAEAAKGTAEVSMQTGLRWPLGSSPATRSIKPLSEPVRVRPTKAGRRLLRRSRWLT